MGNRTAIAALVAVISAAPAVAHEAGYDSDMLENTSQCAAYWFAEDAVRRVLDSDGAEDDGMIRAFGGIFRKLAIQSADGDVAKADYMIFAQLPYFTRLFGDSLGPAQNPYATEILNNQGQYCQNVGMFYGPDEGFH